MKKAAVVVAVMVLALALSQSAMAAPTQGYTMAFGHTNSDSLYGRLLGLFGAIWGGGNNGAIWGGRDGGSTDGAIWGCKTC